MLLLGIDTSGRQGSLALVRAQANSLQVLDIVSLSGGSYSARLIPELSAMLSRHSLQKTDIEGYAVVSGPGSFTGLRIGLATAKGLAEVVDRPIAAISMLEAIAAQANTGHSIAALDAGRKELFVGEYQVKDGAATLLRECLLSQEQFAALLDANPNAELIVPDMAVAESAGLHMKIRQVEWPDAAEIARLGFKKIERGQTTPGELLEANYIGRSDAELFCKRG